MRFHSILNDPVVTGKYFFLDTKRHHLTLRFGLEKKPLFSERYQGTRNIPKRWHYLFGKRLSWRYDRRKP